MAKVIYRLWKDDNKDLMILPGSLPLHDGSARNELTYYLPAGWDAVIEKDIDGDRAETTELENKEPRFGQVNAARRVARTIFLGSAPSSVATKAATRGLDSRPRPARLSAAGPDIIHLLDALNRLADRLHYLNSSGDKAQDATRFWFDTRANLRREMEDRKRRFDDKTEVRGKIAEALKKVVGHVGFFDGVHIFTPHADVPDDTALRLVVLPPEHWYSREETRLAVEAVLDSVRNNGPSRAIAAIGCSSSRRIMASWSRLSDAAAMALAWDSIVEDVKEGRLNIDNLQQKQAEKEFKSAEDVLPRAARECYKWLLCPVQDTPTDPKPTVEAFPLNTTGGSARQRDRASLHRQRTGHHDLVADPPADQAQGAVLEGRPERGERRLLGGHAALSLPAALQESGCPAPGDPHRRGAAGTSSARPTARTARRSTGSSSATAMSSSTTRCC